MKTIKPPTSAITSPNELVKSTIAAERIADAIYILRDKIYSDKLKATLVETLSNACDEHKKYNIKRPVEVYLTKENLVIRDFALGLSENNVLKIFFQYFESTKNIDDSAIGGFGIGAKAPLSYNDNFTVTSYFEGKAKTFASLVNGKSSYVTKVFEQDSDEPTGIEVNIPLVDATRFTDYFQFLQLISDSFKMFGFDSEEFPFIYLFNEKESLKKVKSDWAAVLGKKENYSSLDYQQLWLDTYFTEQSRDNILKERFAAFRNNTFYKKDITFTKVSDNLFILTGERLYQPVDFFNSSFFKKLKFIAYDGDNCYELPITADYFKQYKLSCQTERAIYIFKFNRGELPIAPSREIIEDTASVRAWVNNNLKIISEQTNAKIDNIIKSYYDLNYPLSYIETLVPENNHALYSLVNRHRSLISSWGDLEYMSNKDIFDIGKSIYASSLYDYQITPTNFNSRSSLQYLRSLRNNFIVIEKDTDKKLQVPYSYFLNILAKYINNLYGENAFRDRYVLSRYNKFYLLFADPNNKTWQTIKLRAEGGKLLLRQNVDIFNCDDILALSEYKRNSSKKPDAEKTIVEISAKLKDTLIDYNTSEKIPEDEYKETYIFSPSDLKKIQGEIDHYKKYKDDYNLIGVKHIALVYKNNFNFFEELGCSQFCKLNLNEKIQTYCRSINLKIIPESVEKLFSRIGLNLCSLLNNKTGVIKSRENTIQESVLVSVYDWKSPVGTDGSPPGIIPVGLLKNVIRIPYSSNYQNFAFDLMEDFYKLVYSNENLKEHFSFLFFSEYGRHTNSETSLTTFSKLETDYHDFIKKQFATSREIIKPLVTDYFTKKLFTNEYPVYY